jgi:hypothetical protein
MDMVWHNNIFVQYRIGKMLWYFQPALLRNLSGIVQNHFVVRDFPEQTMPVLYAYCYKTIPPANNRILSGECCDGDGCRGCNALFLIFFLIIDFVKLTVFVRAFFYQIVVAVYVDMEILVQLDDAFKYTCLLFYGTVGNSEIVGKVNVVLLLIGGFIQYLASILL